MKKISKLISKTLITTFTITSITFLFSCSSRITPTTPSINLENDSSNAITQEEFNNLTPNEADNVPFTPNGPADIDNYSPGDMGPGDMGPGNMKPDDAKMDNIQYGNPPGMPPKENGMHNQPGDNNSPANYKAVNTYSNNKLITDLNVTSTESDESAVLVENGANVTINNFTINRENSNSSGGDSASFYGVGAAVLSANGNLTLRNGTITTNSKGGAGVFSYGKGTANLSNVIINTNDDTSGGIHVAGGGTLNATNVTVTTNGKSSAAIRSDRGGGQMNVTGGTYTSNGEGSPAIYCTADINVSDATLTANGSEAICIEGLNTTTLKNVTLTSSMKDLYQNDITWSVIIYQSMSGDSTIGKGTFNMEGGKIISTNGGLFYTTNTESEFNLKNVELNPSDDFEFLLQVTGNRNERGWGSKGSNGANCTFNADSQKLDGKILYDSISTLSLNLKNDSIFTGEIIDDENYAGKATGNGYADVYVDKSSTWVVTSSCIINNLTLEGKLVDEDGNDVNVVDMDENILREGKSDITVTVKSFNS